MIRCEFNGNSASDPGFRITKSSQERQRQLVNRLCERGVFPHPVKRRALIETHISFVILTGDFAYKIKKAMALDFLDYSTLEQRRLYCEEELRLNRRLAESVYLQVVAIGGSAEAPKIGDTLAAQEYAVMMREFDQKTLLDGVLARGELTPEQVDVIAALVSAFHREIPVATKETFYGTPQSIAKAMDENLIALSFSRSPSPSPPLAVTGGDPSALPAVDKAEFEALKMVDELAAWSRRQCSLLGPVFSARRAGGFVRECHGDMHLGNMLWGRDGLQIFDGIEFNPEFRWIDVLSEIAFLVMDLSERGRPDYAYRLLNAYLEETGDYAGLPVLRFYLVFRALVRAKVAGIRARQAIAGSPEHLAAQASRLAYLAYAHQLIAPARPVLIVMHGFSGSGKTFVSQRLLEALPAIRIRSDVERKRLQHRDIHHGSNSGLASGLYGPAETLATYQRMNELATTLLNAGFNVILDATFLRRWQRDAALAISANTDTSFYLVDCVAPQKELEARVGKRLLDGGDASEADATVVAHQIASANPLGDDERQHAIVVAMGQSTGNDEAIGQLIDILKSSHGLAVQSR